MAFYYLYCYSKTSIYSLLRFNWNWISFIESANLIMKRYLLKIPTTVLVFLNYIRLFLYPIIPGLTSKELSLIPKFI